MKNTPKTIYLNTGLDQTTDFIDFNELSEISWSEEKINDADIEFTNTHNKAFAVCGLGLHYANCEIMQPSANCKLCEHFELTAY